MDPKIIEKFYNLIIKDKISRCWNWTGAIDKHNAPTLNGLSARRISLHLCGKDVAQNNKVKFICGNNLCVNQTISAIVFRRSWTHLK